MPKVSKSPKKKPGRNKAPKEQLVINVPEGGAILEITIKVPGGATLELPAGYAPATTDKPTDPKASSEPVGSAPRKPSEAARTASRVAPPNDPSGVATKPGS